MVVITCCFFFFFKSRQFSLLVSFNVATVHEQNFGSLYCPPEFHQSFAYGPCQSHTDTQTRRSRWSLGGGHVAGRYCVLRCPLPGVFRDWALLSSCLLMYQESLKCNWLNTRSSYPNRLSYPQGYMLTHVWSQSY